MMTMRKVANEYCDICDKMKSKLICLTNNETTIFICKDCIKLLNRFIS